MRTIIDISDEQVKALDELSRIEETSRVALIRRAIDKLLAQEAQSGLAYDTAFGLWQERSQKAKSARRSPRESAPVATEQPNDPLVVNDAPVTAEAVSSELMSELQVPTPKEEELLPANAPTVEEPVPARRESGLVSTDPLAAFFLAGRGTV